MATSKPVCWRLRVLTNWAVTRLLLVVFEVMLRKEWMPLAKTGRNHVYPVLQTETAESWVLYATWGFAFNICNCLSVCLSVLPSVWQFPLVFSDFLDNDRLLEYSKPDRAIFPGKFLFARFLEKGPWMAPK